MRGRSGGRDGRALRQSTVRASGGRAATTSRRLRGASTRAVGRGSLAACDTAACACRYRAGSDSASRLRPLCRYWPRSDIAEMLSACERVPRAGLVGRGLTHVLGIARACADRSGARWRVGGVSGSVALARPRLARRALDYVSVVRPARGSHCAAPFPSIARMAIFSEMRSRSTSCRVSARCRGRPLPLVGWACHSGTRL